MAHWTKLINEMLPSTACYSINVPPPPLEHGTHATPTPRQESSKKAVHLQGMMLPQLLQGEISFIPVIITATAQGTHTRCV